MIGTPPSEPVQRYNRGLGGLVAGDTAIGLIDGIHGRLLYRGYDVADLVEHTTFEEVSFLILFGELPDQTELDLW